MSITRRTALQWLASASAVTMLASAESAPQSQSTKAGPYQEQWPSLQQHACPGWYRDAKFGIYLHGDFTLFRPSVTNGIRISCTFLAGRNTIIKSPLTGLSTSSAIRILPLRLPLSSSTLTRGSRYSRTPARAIWGLSRNTPTASPCGTAALFLGTPRAWVRIGILLARWSGLCASRG
jgi:hypothetical protein